MKDGLSACQKKIDQESELSRTLLSTNFGFELNLENNIFATIQEEIIWRLYIFRLSGMNVQYPLSINSYALVHCFNNLPKAVYLNMRTYPIDGKSVYPVWNILTRTGRRLHPGIHRVTTLNHIRIDLSIPPQGHQSERKAFRECSCLSENTMLAMNSRLGIYVGWNREPENPHTAIAIMGSRFPFLSYSTAYISGLGQSSQWHCFMNVWHLEYLRLNFLTNHNTAVLVDIRVI